VPPASVYYLVPDHATPSWGIGLLYHHVRLLRKNGLAAWVLHARAPFRLEWLDVTVPVRHLDEPGFAPRREDVVVIPEVLAKTGAELPFPSRRIVFVQGMFLALSAFAEAVDYGALGYQGAMTTLPHGETILERHFGMRPAVVPPFVAPYFFAPREALSAERRLPRILLIPKAGYRAAGIPDYDIARKLIARRCRPTGLGGTAHPVEGWELLELENLSHRDVAGIMRTAAFLVSVNSHEAFNATVPEAMAAGCLVLCYDAYGGRDFLVDGENAFVFPNQHVYPLVDRLFELLDRYETMAEPLARLRTNAYATAQRYREEATEAALLVAFRPFLA
jgi:Glycosyl transferases group 1